MCKILENDAKLIEQQSKSGRNVPRNAVTYSISQCKNRYQVLPHTSAETRAPLELEQFFSVSHRKHSFRTQKDRVMRTINDVPCFARM